MPFGLRVGTPCDLRNGYDLRTQAGQWKAWEELYRTEPEVIVMGPVCTPWGSWSNMKPKWKVAADRKLLLPMAYVCIDVCLCQSKKGRFFILEQPQKSAMW